MNCQKIQSYTSSGTDGATKSNNNVAQEESARMLSLSEVFERSRQRGGWGRVHQSKECSRGCYFGTLMIWWVLTFVTLPFGEMLTYFPPRTMSSMGGFFYLLVKAFVWTRTDQWETFVQYKQSGDGETVLDYIFLTGLVLLAMFLFVLFLYGEQCRKHIAKANLVFAYIALLLAFYSVTLAQHDHIPVHAVVIVAIFCVYIIAVFIEFNFGLTLPSCGGHGPRPAEALLGLLCFMKTIVCITWVFDATYFYLVYDTLLVTDIILVLLSLGALSCPLIFKYLLYRPILWGGPAWQGFILPMVAALPWDKMDERLEPLCRRGMHYGVQALLPTVPLQMGYDADCTGRLKVMISFLGGKSFSLNGVKHLVNSRGDPNATDEDGLTLLGVAVSRNEVKLVRFLLGLKPVRARINQVNSKGLSAIFFAKSPEVFRLLFHAGADTSLKDPKDHTAYMHADVELRKLLSESRLIPTWPSVEASLPSLRPRSQLFDLLWDEYLTPNERQSRLDIVVKHCILELLERNSSKPLNDSDSASLRQALVATRCPSFFEHELKDNKRHLRGDAYDLMLQTVMAGFENDLNVERDLIMKDPLASNLMAIKAEKERLNTDLINSRWPEDEPLSQAVAEDIPEWIQRRSLCGAFGALAKVEVVSSVSDFSDLLNGQHRLFDGESYTEYLGDRKSDVFWLAMYTLYDIGKTSEICDEFQEGMRLAVGAPYEEGDSLYFHDGEPPVRFKRAGVKGFKRSIEKILKDLEEIKVIGELTFEDKLLCAARVKDKARNTFICSNVGQLCNLIERFANLRRKEVNVRPGVILRFTSIERKSSYSQPTHGGYADVKYWILVEKIFYDTEDTPSAKSSGPSKAWDAQEARVEVAFISETQLILERYLSKKEQMHIAYEARRGDFDVQQVSNHLLRASTSISYVSPKSRVAPAAMK